MPAEVNESFRAFSVSAWQVLKDRAGADLSEAIEDTARIEDEIAAAAAKEDITKSLEARLNEKEDLLRARVAVRADKSANSRAGGTKFGSCRRRLRFCGQGSARRRVV